MASYYHHLVVQRRVGYFLNHIKLCHIVIYNYLLWNLASIVSNPLQLGNVFGT